MSSDSPILLSSINPTHNALCLSPTSSNDVLIVYASGFIINILDATSLALYQSINLFHHLPQSDHCSINALHLSHQNLRLIVSCGHLSVVFERSTSISYSSWKLHSTFSSHISNITSIQLKDSYCLVAGHDGISIHQLQENSIDSDEPPRWTKRWMHRGQPCDHAVFEMLDDSSCLVAAFVVGSSIVELYEFYPSESSHYEFSRNPLCFSLPIHSVHFTQISPFDPSRWPLSLMAQVINPVLGIGIHFYDLVKQLSPVIPENCNQHQSSSRPKPKVHAVHNGTCAISCPLNSPRILAAFPLNNLSERLLSQYPQLINHGARLLLVVLSNGEVNLAQSSKNTSLLSSTPLILPGDMLGLLQTQGSKIQIAVAMVDSSSEPGHTSCSMIVRPLTSTGQIFITEIPLDGLLVPPVAVNVQSQLLSLKTVPYGFTPFFTPISFDYHEQVPFSDLFVTASKQDEDARYICLVKEGSIPKSRLLAYAAVTENDVPIGEVQAAGCFQHKFGYSEGKPQHSTAAVVRSTPPSPSHFGQTGVFISYLNHKIHTSVQTLSLEKIRLTGFLKSERPKTLITKLLNCNKNHDVKARNSFLCLTSFNRLVLWDVPDALNSFDRKSYLPHEISLPGSLLSNTLSLSGSSAPLILALDTDNQLVRSTLPEDYHDPNLKPLELKKTSTHPIGAKSSLNLTDSMSQAIILESHVSRFIAMLWLLHDTNQSQTYKVVILDLEQQPYSSGIVGLDDFEIAKDSNYQVSNAPQLKWSGYQKTSNLLNSCFLAVCCGGSMVRVYNRDIDAWWKPTIDLHSKFGSITQISWITNLDDSILLYQTAGHTLALPIANPPRINLPLWHPIALNNRFLFGNFSLVMATLACLSLALKGVTQPLTLLSEMLLSSYLVEEDTVIIEKLNNCASAMSPTTLSLAHIDLITNAVNKHQIPLLCALLHLSKAFLQVQTAQSHGIDLYGCQYIFSLINYLRKRDSGVENDQELGFDLSQDCSILVAQLSSTQSLLAHETCSILRNQFNNKDGSEFKLDWNTARSIGLFLWLKDQDEINQSIEKVGQVEYITGGKKMSNNNVREQDPAACSLFYMALKKKRLLLGLWKVAYGHSDRNLMLKFLQNDFSEQRWKTAAQKNAFALLSRQRFSFAASFFLLADRLQDAVNICVQRLSDWQLGIAICRAYEGDKGPVLKKLLMETVLPVGFSSANRWLISWCFNMLFEFDLARQALVVPWGDLLKLQTTWCLSPIECHAVRVGPLDLSLILLYNQLQIKFPQSYSSITWDNEKNAILLFVEQLINSGFNNLVIVLLKNWNFNIHNPSKTKKSIFSSPSFKQIEISFDLKQHGDKNSQLNHSQPIVPEFDMSKFF